MRRWCRWLCKWRSASERTQENLSTRAFNHFFRGAQNAKFSKIRNKSKRLWASQFLWRMLGMRMPLASRLPFWSIDFAFSGIGFRVLGQLLAFFNVFLNKEFNKHLGGPQSSSRWTRTATGGRGDQSCKTSPTTTTQSGPDTWPNNNSSNNNGNNVELQGEEQFWLFPRIFQSPRSCNGQMLRFLIQKNWNHKHFKI